MASDSTENVIALFGVIGFAHCCAALPIAVKVDLPTGIFAAALGCGFFWGAYKIFCTAYTEAEGDGDDPDEEDITEEETNHECEIIPLKKDAA